MPFQGYSINGYALHNPSKGWKLLRDGTSTQGGITNSLNKVALPNRPGFSPAPYTFTEQAMVFVIRCTRESLEGLLNLAAAAKTLTRTDDTTKVARVQLASAIPVSDAPFDSMFSVTITLIAFDGVWRDAIEQVGESDGTKEIAISGAPFFFNVFPGLGAPISDFSFFLKGQFGSMTMVDAVSSRIQTIRPWPGLSTHGLLYNGATAQAYLANASSPWVPVSDATQYISVSGNGGFQINPYLDNGDPFNRRGYLSITVASATNVTIRFRGKRAYRMN